MMFYGALFIYAIAAGLFPTGKYIAYIELVVVIGFIQYQHEMMLYCLLLIPLISMVSSEIKTYDNLAYSVSIAVLIFLQTENEQFAAIGLLGSYMLLGMFQLKFKEIEKNEREIREIRKENHKTGNLLIDKQRELDIISRMFNHIRRVNETIEMKKIIDEMLESSRDVFKADYACLYQKDEDGVFVLKKYIGENKRHEVPSYFDPNKEDVFMKKNQVIRLPIHYDNNEWGAIAVYDKRTKLGKDKQMMYFPFQDEDVEILSVYIQHSVVQMKHASLVKRYHDLANNDYLTGVPNRRCFMQQFDYLMARAERGDGLVFSIIDIDNFKRFNDTYGHKVGDQVLKIVANTLQDSVRKMDVICRWGGEEFAILLPNTKENEFEILERVRKRVNSVPFRPVEGSSETVTISVSIGYASFGEHGDSTNELVSRADLALYRSKTTGKNKVTVFGDDME